MDVAEVLARVRAIPPGKVAAYGDVTPGAPRHAGRVLSASHEPDVPWWRVVRADGTLAKGDRQKELLRAEGVRFHPTRPDRVDMAECRASGSSARSP